LLSVFEGKDKRVSEVSCRAGILGSKTIIMVEFNVSIGMSFKWDS